MNIGDDTHIILEQGKHLGDVIHHFASQPASVWDEFTFRQDSYSVHRDTKTIAARWADNSLSDARWLPQYEQHRTEFDTLIGMAIAAIRRHYGYKAVPLRAMVAMLPAGKTIPYHKDQGSPIFATAHRIHIPLVNFPVCDFYIEGKIVPMNVGTVVEINNKKMHKVENYSVIDRLQFICDAEPSSLT